MIVSAIINAAVIYIPAIFAYISMAMVFAGMYTMLLGYGTNDEDVYNDGMRGIKMGSIIGYTGVFLYFVRVVLC